MFNIEALLAWGGVLIVAAIVFAESGLFVGFFLPGDSLLFIAGFFASRGTFNIVVLLVAVFIAAVVGDSVGYTFGHRVGRSLFAREDSRFFKQAHLQKAEAFYDKYGKRTIVLARFVPVVRTFAPIVAGTSKMHYGTFLRYNLIGGFCWAVGVTSLGYFFGGLLQQLVGKDNIEVALLGVSAVIVVISVVPIIFEYRKARRESAAAAENDRQPVSSGPDGDISDASL